MSTALVVVASISVGLTIIRLYREWQWGSYSNSQSLKGQVFLITGANSGVGKETARQLLQRQATVVMGNRDKTRTEKAIEEIRKTTSEGEIVTLPLDLASFESIKDFASQVNKQFSKIDVLINNAGVSFPLESKDRTKEGFEMNIGVNHFGHFLLTKLLLAKLKESAPSRIVIVSSTLHEKGKIDLDDINLDKLRDSGKKSPMTAYSNSKLANAYHGRELAERLKGEEISVRLLCPGFTYTGLFRQFNIKWWQYILFAPIAFFYMRSAWKGSQTIVYCATEKNLPGKSGDFYRDCKLYQSKAKFDDQIQKGLWELSDKLVSK